MCILKISRKDWLFQRIASEDLYISLSNVLDLGKSQVEYLERTWTKYGLSYFVTSWASERLIKSTPFFPTNSCLFPDASDTIVKPKYSLTRKALSATQGLAPGVRHSPGIAIQMGTFRHANGRSTESFLFLRPRGHQGVQQHKLEVHCNAHWRCAAVLFWDVVVVWGYLAFFRYFW